MKTESPTTRYALLRDGQQISKAHSTEFAASMEAYELGLVVSDKYGKHLVAGCEIREVP